jgi:hypothetical protein
MSSSFEAARVEYAFVVRPLCAERRMVRKKRRRRLFAMDNNADETPAVPCRRGSRFAGFFEK